MDQRQLRALVAHMDERVALAVRSTADDDDRRELARSWDALARYLDVGPAPATRACPACGREIMQAATLCGYCWTRSTDGEPHA